MVCVIAPAGTSTSALVVVSVAPSPGTTTTEVPLGTEDAASVKKGFGFDPAATFHVPDDVAAFFSQLASEKAREEAVACALYERYRTAFFSEAAEIDRRFSGSYDD